MSIKTRLKNIEAKHRRERAVDLIPFAVIIGDEVSVAGETVTLAEYEERYRPLIEAAEAAGTVQDVFAIRVNVVNPERAPKVLAGFQGQDQSGDRSRLLRGMAGAGS